MEAIYINMIAQLILCFSSAMQQFRHAVQLFLGNVSPDINLQCVDPTLGGHYTPFPQVRASCSCASAALVFADTLSTPASPQHAALIPNGPKIPADINKALPLCMLNTCCAMPYYAMCHGWCIAQDFGNRVGLCDRYLLLENAQCFEVSDPAHCLFRLRSPRSMDA